MKFQIVKKAWHVFHIGMIDASPEYYHTPDETPVVYAATEGEAKAQASAPQQFNLPDGSTPKFTDLRCLRAHTRDIVIFNDHQTERFQAEYQILREAWINKRRKQVLKYPETEMFYVQNGFVGNAILFWGLNSSGYTANVAKAQKYTRAEILERFIDGREQDIIWPASHIDAVLIHVADNQKTNGNLSI